MKKQALIYTLPLLCLLLGWTIDAETKVQRDLQRGSDPLIEKALEMLQGGDKR